MDQTNQLVPFSIGLHERNDQLQRCGLNELKYHPTRALYRADLTGVKVYPLNPPITTIDGSYEAEVDGYGSPNNIFKRKGSFTCCPVASFSNYDHYGI
ncbi:MAG: hypothetical protein M3410_04130 [Acidobacteriota bacterium]|nr:hypothetical protein [Acidobacteriota bacterium]